MAEWRTLKILGFGLMPERNRTNSDHARPRVKLIFQTSFVWAPVCLKRTH
jgi:hypothetical protein